MADSIRQQYDYEIRLRETHLDFSIYFDPNRVQYSADGILSQLLENAPVNPDKLVGIAGLDLYIPVLTFIFGQAYLNGQAAIVSGYRLKNEFYGLAPDEELFWHRLTKSVIHELGHTFGLKHCINFRCVMNSTTYVEEIDQKSENLCQTCSGLLMK